MEQEYEEGAVYNGVAQHDPAAQAEGAAPYRTWDEAEGAQQTLHNQQTGTAEGDLAAQPEADAPTPVNGVAGVAAALAAGLAADIDMELESGADAEAPKAAGVEAYATAMPPADAIAMPPPPAADQAAFPPADTAEAAIPQPPPGDGATGEAAPAPAPAEAAEPRKRRHQWGPPAKGEFLTLEELQEKRKKKKRSRWESAEDEQQLALIPVLGASSGAIIVPGQMPREVTLTGGTKIVLAGASRALSRDPRVAKLQEQLVEIERKLASNDLDIPPEGDPRRSPSPEPMYDKDGVRLNTREIRARNKLSEKRLTLIEDIIKSDPDYKPPMDYKPRKFSNKIYIPINEYPGYNFIGLIIGPRGNTQKRMQTETNTKIAIRGKGSVKEGITRDYSKYDYGEDEELHVLITGDNQADVDRASAMIERMCTPMDDAHNEHKRLQLRELALINGTLKDEEAALVLASETNPLDVYKLPSEMAAKVQEQYERDVARVSGQPVVRSDEEYRAFLAELGGAPPPEMMGLDGPGGGGDRGADGRRHAPMPDECKLFVGNLPPAYDTNMLRALFEPVAEAAGSKVVHSAVITEPGSGASRGFGFIHIPDPIAAKACRDALDNHQLEPGGRGLVVRLRSEKGQRQEGGGGGGGGGSHMGGPGLGLHHRGPGGEREVDESKLYVAGLTPHSTEEPVRELFGRYGEVVEVRIITDRDSGLCKGFCFVGFASKEQAQAAKYGLDGYKLEGKTLTVRTAGQRDDRGAGRGPPGGGGGGFSQHHQHPGDRQGAIRGPHGTIGGHGGPPPPPGGPPPPPPPGPHGWGPPGGGPPPPGPHGYGGPPPHGYGGPPPPPGQWGWDPYGNPLPPPGQGYMPYGPPMGGYGGYGPPPGYGAPPPPGYGAPPPGYGPPPPPYGEPPMPPPGDGAPPPPPAEGGAGGDPYGAPPPPYGVPPPPPPPGGYYDYGQQQHGGYGGAAPQPPPPPGAPQEQQHGYGGGAPPPPPPGQDHHQQQQQHGYNAVPPPPPAGGGGGQQPPSEYERFMQELSSGMR